MKTSGYFLIDKNGDEWEINCNFDAILKYPEDHPQGEYVIPEGIRSIGDKAFQDCKNLTSVIIPDSVDSIGDRAFEGCINLTNINIPKKVSYIGEYAFYRCERLKNIDLPNEITGIKRGTFCGCTGLTSIVIPNSVETIEYQAFNYCKGLVSVAFGSGVSIIGSGAFKCCTKLASLIIPDSVTSIGYMAFEDCTGLTSISLSSNLHNIGGRAFFRCTGLTSINIPNEIKEIGEDAFYFVPNIVFSNKAIESMYGFPWGAKSMNGYIDGYMVYKDISKRHLLACSSAVKGKIVIPESVIIIGWYALSDCPNLTSVQIHENIKNVENQAFADCPCLKEIIIPSGSRERYMQMRGIFTEHALIVEQDTEEQTILLNLAKAYEKGIGIRQNYTHAASAYAQAAEEGSAEAAYHLGEWYEQGEYVPYDLAKALDYYQQAAKSCYLDSAEKVEKLKEEIEAQQRQEEERLRKEAEAKRQAEQKLEEARKSAERNADPYYLFFDTETTGLPRSMKASVRVTENWPRLVQLAWLLVTKNGDVIKKRSAIIYPDDFVIPEEASMIHGITTERARREGKPLVTVIDEFMQDFENVICLVAHNIEFDQNIIGAELCRLNRSYDSFMYHKETICTMLSSTDYCAIPSINGHDDYKWPKLQELYHKLFNKYFDDAHDALADITATKECFFELKKRGII